MAIYDELVMAESAIEDATEFFRRQDKILKWPDLRPGQRVAALVINVISHESMEHPTAPQLASFLGIALDRAQALFDGIEHPPFALTKIGTDYERFVPSQTLAYREEYEGGGA